jgi:DNA-directed RNA polymerase specialized sigma24 family protein
MIELHSPEQLTVTELIREAHLETQLFLRDQSPEHVCAFELFRRAIVLRDEQAWFGIYELYNAVVSSWILHLVPKLEGPDFEALVNGVFAKFARAVNAQRGSDFSCVQGLLGYLKRCAESVVADHCRSQRARLREETFEFLDQEPVLDDPADLVATQLAAQELWQLIWREVTSVEERLIVQLVCALGLSPRELQRRYSHVFTSVDDIYRIKRNVLERLRRNKALLQLLDRQSPHQQREVRHAS